MIRNKKFDYGIHGQVYYFTIKKDNKLFFIAAKRLRKESFLTHSGYTKAKAIAENKLAQKLRENSTSLSKLSIYKLVLKDGEYLLVTEDLSQGKKFQVYSLATDKRNLTTNTIKTIAKDLAILHNLGYRTTTDCWLIRKKGNEKEAFLCDLGNINSFPTNKITQTIHTIKNLCTDKETQQIFIEEYVKNIKEDKEETKRQLYWEVFSI